MIKTIAFLNVALMFLLTSCHCEQAKGVPPASVAEIMNGKAIVVYFSCTGNTANAAKRIAEATGWELYEITPETPYSDKDLDWRDNDSRSCREHADAKARPPLAGELPDYGKYDTVYLGYPIWWGEAPRIVLTFLEASAAGLKGKTIIPFCTSYSSPLGGSDTKLHASAPDADWLPGKRFRLTPSQAEVADWLKSFLAAEE